MDPVQEQSTSQATSQTSTTAQSAVPVSSQTPPSAPVVRPPVPPASQPVVPPPPQSPLQQLQQPPQQPAAQSMHLLTSPSSPPPPPQPTVQTPPLPPQSSNKSFMWILLGVIIVLAVAVAGWFVFGQKKSAPSIAQKVVPTIASTPTPLPFSDYTIFFTHWTDTAGPWTHNGIYYLDGQSAKLKILVDNPDYLSKNQVEVYGIGISQSGKYVGWLERGSKTPLRYALLSNLQLGSIQSVAGSGKDALPQIFRFSQDEQKLALLEQTGSSKGTGIKTFSYMVSVFDIATAKLMAQFQIIPPFSANGMLNFAWSKSDKIRAIFSIPKPNGGEDYKVVSYSAEGVKDFEKMVASSSSRPRFYVTRDGESMAYVKKTSTNTNSKQFERELWYGSIDGTNVQKVASFAAENCGDANVVSVSPNKKWAVVTGGCADSAKSQIVDLTSGKIIDVLMSIIPVTWSSDSSYFVASHLTYQKDGTSLLDSTNIVSTTGKTVKKLDIIFSDAWWLPK